MSAYSRIQFCIPDDALPEVELRKHPDLPVLILSLAHANGDFTISMKPDGLRTFLTELLAHPLLALPLPESALLTKAPPPSPAVDAAPIDREALAQDLAIIAKGECWTGTAMRIASSWIARIAAPPAPPIPPAVTAAPVVLKEGTAPALGVCDRWPGVQHAAMFGCVNWRPVPLPEKQSQSPAPVVTALTEKQLNEEKK